MPVKDSAFMDNFIHFERSRTPPKKIEKKTRFDTVKVGVI